ncbi:MAG: amidohydrolase family protein [Gammaproteobacteria bacterium]|nr:amidohydrolase family protein [Gammaproteobacteria bacterium]
MKRRTFLSLLTVAAAGGALWWQRDWLPVRGLSNPCLTAGLPVKLAEHPAVAEALADLDMTKVWDCHVHLLGTGDKETGGVWINPVMDSMRHPIQAMQKQLYLNASCVTEGEGGDEGFIQRLIALSEPVSGMRLMLLAFDYNYDDRGRRRPERSTFYISNAYAQSVAARDERLEWVCSVHPYREDAVEALEWAAARGARAVKWLPPAMGMDPSSPRCDPFYQSMQRLGLPLLTHGGDELAVQGGGHQNFGNPLLLRRPLENGVRVIVAHCASQGIGRDLQHSGKSQPERSNFSLFMDMMRDSAYSGLLYGDISATTQLNRAPEALRSLLQAEDLHHRLLNGSDYPLAGILPLFSQSQLEGLGLLDPEMATVIFELQKYNPLLFDLVLKRNLRWQGHRFPGAVFETSPVFLNRTGDLYG